MSRRHPRVVPWLSIVAAAPMLLQAQSPKPGLSAKAKAQIDSVRRAVAEFADPRVAELLAGKTVRKVIVVPGRMINIVAD